MHNSIWLRTAAVTFALGGMGCASHKPFPASLEFLEGCWQDLKSPAEFSHRIEFTRKSDGALTGTLRDVIRDEPVLGFVLPTHGESIEVTSYPAVRYVSGIQTVTLKRARFGNSPADCKGCEEAAFEAPAYMSHLSFTVWWPEGEAQQILFHVADLEGWTSTAYEKELVVIADRIRCSG